MGICNLLNSVLNLAFTIPKSLLFRDIGHCDANDQVCIMTASDIQKGVKIAKGSHALMPPLNVIIFIVIL